MDAPYRWIESNSWELDFFGLPHRIPWPSDVDESKANEDPFDTVELVRAIEMLGPDAVGPWNAFKAASVFFDDLAEALEDGEFPRAAELLEEIEKVMPGTSFVKFHRGVVARMDGRFEEAIEHYRAAAEQTPNIAELWKQLGMTLAQEGKRDEAVPILFRALQIAQDDRATADALVQLRALIKLMRDPKDPNSAIYVDHEHYRKMVTPQIEALMKTPDDLVGFGEFNVREGYAPDLGIQALEKALAMRPEHPQTLVALANAYRATDQPEKAREMIEKYTQLFPNDPTGFFNLAQIRNATGDEEGERAALDRVIELDPNHHAAIGIRFGLSNEPSEVKEKEVVEFAEKKNSWMAFLIASAIARDRSDAVAAVNWAGRAYAIAPDAEPVLLQYAVLLGDTKDSARLMALIEPKVLSGKYSKQLDWNFAQALHSAGRTQEAINTLNRAARPENAPQDFKAAAATAIDTWSNLVAKAEVPVEVHRSGILSRPVLIALADGDGGVVLKPGLPVPQQNRFPWRTSAPGRSDAQVCFQQGQTGSAKPAVKLGTFTISEILAKPDEIATIDCHVAVGPNGVLQFRAYQNGRKLQVSWSA